MEQAVNAGINIPSLMFTAMALVVAGVTAFEDAKSGKIKNRMIVSGIAAAAFLHVFFICYFVYTSWGSTARFDPGYILDLLLNAAVAFVCAAVMWKAGVWSAGDSKLFAALAFILPLDHYAKGYMPVFPASALMINIFIVSFLVVAVRFITGTFSLLSSALQGRGWKNMDIPGSLTNAYNSAGKNIHSYFIMFVIFNILHFLIYGLKNHIPTGSPIFLNLLFMAFMYGIMPALSGGIMRLFDKMPFLRRLFPALVAVFLFTLYFRFQATFGTVAQTGKITAGFMVIAGLLRKIVEAFFEHMDVYTSPSGKVKAGMVPTPATRKILEDEAGLDMFFMDGLSEEQARAVREHLPGEKELSFVLTIPFAPLAFAGLVTTLVFKMSLLHLIFSMAGRN